MNSSPPFFIFFIFSTIVFISPLIIRKEYVYGSKPTSQINKNVQKNTTKEDHIKVFKEIWIDYPRQKKNIENKQKERQNKTVSLSKDGSGYTPFFEVDKEPELLKFIKPPYPPLAKENHIEGDVLLRVYINEEGRVDKVIILKRAGFGFDEAALNALKNAIFSPAKKNEKNVAVWIDVPVRFRLEEE